MEAKNFDYYGSVSVNGKTRSGIQIELTDLGTGNKVTELSSGARGLFSFYNLPDGRYQLTNVYYKTTQGKSWADLTLRPATPIVFVKNGEGVYNLGNFSAWGDKAGGKYSAVNLGDWDQVKEEFLQDYPKSIWTRMEWYDQNR